MGANEEQDSPGGHLPLVLRHLFHRHDAQHRCCAISRSRGCHQLPVCTHDSTLPLLLRLPVAKQLSAGSGDIREEGLQSSTMSCGARPTEFRDHTSSY